MVLWFGPSIFQNLAIHVSNVRCQYEESSCRASVPTSPRNLESFSVHQIVDPGIVEVTLFQKANQTQPLHNSTLKMKPFLAFLIKMFFLAHFRGSWPSWFCGLVCPSFKIWPSTYRSYVVSMKNCPCTCPLKLLKLYRSYVVSTNNCPGTVVNMPFEAAQARKDSCFSCLSKSAPTTILWKCKLFVNADSFVATFMVRSVSISRICRVKKFKIEPRTMDRMIAWSIAMMFNLSLSLPISTGFFQS